MDKDGLNIGSASVTLIFVVLCMTVLSVISYTYAGNDMAMTETEARMVKGYYEADTLAETRAAELPAQGAGEWDETLKARVAEFTCEISEQKELYVKIAVYADTYDIISWQVRSTEEWSPDTNLPVWLR